jgi:hypothetical protein
MPDIAKCWGRECPVKEKCFRFTAKPSERQTYFANPPFIDGRCDFFWGETQESIMQQLEDIVNNQNKSDDKL